MSQFSFHTWNFLGLVGTIIEALAFSFFLWKKSMVGLLEL
jgi:hypothetical protein